MLEIPLGKYAKRMRMSRALVIKLILQKKLRSKEVMEEGRKRIYILVDEAEWEKPKERLSLLQRLNERGMKFFQQLMEEGFRLHTLYRDEKSYYALLTKENDTILLQLIPQEKNYTVKVLQKVTDELL